MSAPSAFDVRTWIRTVPDFPQPGVMFRDVTPLFADPRGFRLTVDLLLQPFAGKRIPKVAGLEARGFVLGGAVAHQLSAGFVAMRKAGKLPGERIAQKYQLEYAAAELEVQTDGVAPGEGVLIVDDLLATGGTAEAAVRLVERMGGEVAGAAFVVDLPDLGGRKRLEAMGVEVHALCAYAGD